MKVKRYGHIDGMLDTETGKIIDDDCTFVRSEDFDAAIREIDAARAELRQHLQSPIAAVDLVDGIRQLAQIALTNAGNVATLEKSINSLMKVVRGDTTLSHACVTLANVGYRGQRYEVRAVAADGNDISIGWTDKADGGQLVVMVNHHPSWHSPRVIDLHEDKPG